MSHGAEGTSEVKLPSAQGDWGNSEPSYLMHDGLMAVAHVCTVDVDLRLTLVYINAEWAGITVWCISGKSVVWDWIYNIL